MYRIKCPCGQKLARKSKKQDPDLSETKILLLKRNSWTPGLPAIHTRSQRHHHSLHPLCHSSARQLVSMHQVFCYPFTKTNSPTSWCYLCPRSGDSCRRGCTQRLRDGSQSGLDDTQTMLWEQPSWWYPAPAGPALILPSPPIFLPLLQLGLSQHCQEHVWLKKLCVCVKMAP